MNKITVITVCYNAAATIEDTILSVVDQIYPNIEYIIVDGGSTDGTVDIIKKYAAGGSEDGKHNHTITKWISEPDNGIYDAMNKGIDLATGDYINFMNSGDKFTDTSVLETAEQYMSKRDDVYYGDTYRIINGAKILEKPFPFFSQTKKIKYPGICHQSTFVKSRLLKTLKFNIKLEIAADFQLLVRVFESKGKFTYIPMTISNYDCTGISSVNNIQRLKEFAEVSGFSKKSLLVKFLILRHKLKQFCLHLFKSK